MRQVSVTIKVASTWPSREELASRDAVIADLDAASIGTCTGAGGGRGEMDFSYRIVDTTAAQGAIQRAMQEHMPGIAYRVQLSEE